MFGKLTKTATGPAEPLMRLTIRWTRCDTLQRPYWRGISKNIHAEFCGAISVINILQVSKITDTAFTKCKVRLKNVFHVKKYLQMWIFVCIFVLFKKRTL